LPILTDLGQGSGARVSNSHAVVVGGSKGLGLLVTDSFLARGMDVTVLSRTPANQHVGNPRISHVYVDLAETTSIQMALDVLRATLTAGALNYLVLCQRYRGDDDPWTGEIQVGLTASRQLIEGLTDAFSDAGDRAIGIVSSVYARFVGSSQPVGYHVVKAGLNAMVRYYAFSLGSRGVRVNAVMPLTYMKDTSRAYYQSQAQLMDLYDRLVPLRRMGEAGDSANALDFLCSEKASFISGQCLYVDGGVSAVWPEETAKRFQHP
jgi:NAD(P)-dependent dehydrogenase (short-subunit alcohol dehydrogenase family)